jgi:hypothetical protein
LLDKEFAMATEEKIRPDEFGVEADDKQQSRLVWKRDTCEQRTVVLDRRKFFAVRKSAQKASRTWERGAH